MTMFRRNDLDDVLMNLSPLDPWTMRHACENTLIFGKTGSGKSSGSGDAILRALVRYRNSGGLILASKPEDKAYVERVFREERTVDDLFILEPQGKYRFNVLDYERRKGADARDLTQACMTCKETLGRTEGAGGTEDAGFFAAQERRMIHNAIQILLVATREIDPWALQVFITGAAMSLQELNDETWKGEFHNRMLEQAKQKATTDIDKHDVTLAEHYWTSEIPRLNERTRTSIETSALGVLHAMNSGIARDMLSTSTDISPEILEKRQWIMVNMPIVPGDVTAAVVNTAVKYAVQRHILKRQAGAGDPLLCIFSDEIQKLANSYDAMFLAECRSHKGCLVALTQSIHALYANLHGKGGDHQTDALLTNFGHIIVHTLGDAKSAQYASSILGMRREPFISITPQPRGVELFDVLMGRAQASANYSEKYEPVVQPAVFLSGLRSGGTHNRNIVDGVVIRVGQPFHYSRENYLITSFRQR
jgi:type IV secretory pathway TraG/TraD family ATPase VirD4